MADLTGLEPATTRLKGEVTDLFTTGWFWTAGNWRSREPSPSRGGSARSAE